MRPKLLSATLAVGLAVGLLVQLAGLLGSGSVETEVPDVSESEGLVEPPLPSVPIDSRSGSARGGSAGPPRSSRSLLGQVLGPDGTAEGKAQVRLLGVATDGSVAREVEADGQGWFRLDGMPLRPCWIEARTHRFVSGPILVPPEKADPLPIWVGAGASLTGKAISGDGRGSEGLEVSLVLQTAVGPAEYPTGIRTGPEGRFQLTGLRRGESIRLRFREGGRLVHEAPPLSPAREEEIAVRLDG